MRLSLSQVDAALRALDIESLDSLQLLSAEAVASTYFPQLDPGQPALLVGFADRSLAARLAPVLAQVYPLEHRVTLISSSERHAASLAEIAVQPSFAAATALFIPPVPAPSAYHALQDVAAHLRAPEGCPWDRELTWAKLRSSLLEEAHELLAALDADDVAKVREELGDLLLQVAMQTQIATEDGRFRFGDVIAGIVDKLIRRHPHVFGDVSVSGTAEVLANWEAIKATERRNNGEKRSPLSGIPKGLPALAQADAYLDRLSRLRKVEAPDQPWAALAALPADAPITAEVLGETLFGIVAWAQVRGLDAESALRAANARFASAVDQAL
jgi:tetrapyrrole methylase family protein/MazG family protein